MTYGSGYLIDNLAWSNDNVLNTCEEPLKSNILEGLVGVDALELGGILVLKLMIDIIIDVEDSALQVITQSM